MTAVAVLRHQLFDIDLIINRALVLGLAAVIVATGYVGLVVALGSALGAWAEGFWPSLLAFALVAMGFQPLRRRVLRIADRVAYGQRAVPYEALAAFSRGLGEQPDLDLLLPCVAETAADAVSAKSASVRLEMSGGAQHTRRWPQTSDDGASEEPADGGEDAIPVTDRTGRLGSICVTMPAGRPLRPDEHQLLADLADQTAIAFRNARMKAELAAHVSALDARNEELEASRRRLIEAGDAERRRLEAAIARDVLPSLADLPGAVDDVRASLSTGAPAESIDVLVDAATDALEALRDLTRGVFPTVLARSGLGPALSAYVTRTGCSARLVMEPSLADRRFSARVEAAAYFCATEALPDDACADEVRLGVDGPDLVVVVRGRRRDDMDLQAMVDRVEALAGTLVVEDPADGVIRLVVRIPVEHAAQPALQGSTMTRQARVAWVVVALTAVLGAVHTWFFVGWPETRTGPSWPIMTVGAVLMSGLGALVVARRSGHRIGWLFVLIGLSVALSNVLSVNEYVLRAESITLARGPEVALSWLTILVDLPLPGLVLVLTFLLFPTGHLPSPRWRSCCGRPGRPSPCSS